MMRTCKANRHATALAMIARMVEFQCADVFLITPFIKPENLTGQSVKYGKMKNVTYRDKNATVMFVGVK